METKLKFKKGDKVRVKSLEWYNENKDAEGLVYVDKSTNITFTDEMKWMCGYVMQIKEVYDDYYEVFGYVGCWQDWMFEDEPDVEKNQEITNEQKTQDVRNKIIKASLHPKKKEDVWRLLVGTKFFCVNYEEAEKLQRKLIECGCLWSDIGDKIDIERWAIFVCGGGILTHYNKEVVSWSDDSYIAILIEDVLRLEIIPEETPKKFDPKTLQDFQKVLYRSTNTDWWRLGFFEYYNEKQKDKFWIVGQGAHPYEQCVPYNEATENLKGKCFDASNYYINW